MYKLCKTEQSALRQRELELAFASMMMVQRYEDITVSEFCSFAGIPRKAFYRYFSSKDGALYALIDHTMLEYENFREPRTIGSRAGSMKELEGFYQFWIRQKPVLDALEISGLSGVLLERAITSIEKNATLRKLLPGESEFAQRQILRFTVSGIMIMMVNWHHEGYRESPREMADLTARMLNEPLFPYVLDMF